MKIKVLENFKSGGVFYMIGQELDGDSIGNLQEILEKRLAVEMQETPQVGEEDLLEEDQARPIEQKKPKKKKK